MTVSHNQTGYSSCVKSTASRLRHASRTRWRVFVIALRTITIPLDIFPFHFFPSNFCETKFSEGISVHCSFQAHKNAYTFTLHRNTLILTILCCWQSCFCWPEYEVSHFLELPPLHELSDSEVLPVRRNTGCVYFAMEKNSTKILQVRILVCMNVTVNVFISARDHLKLQHTVGAQSEKVTSALTKPMFSSQCLSFQNNTLTQEWISLILSFPEESGTCVFCVNLSLTYLSQISLMDVIFQPLTTERGW